MNRGRYAVKGKVRRVMAFLLIFIMLFTSEGMRVIASQDGIDTSTDVETSSNERLEKNAYIDDDMKLSSSDSIGDMLLGTINDKKEEAEQNGCAVFSAEVSGNTAVFDFQTIYDGTLVAAIYDDTGKQLITSSKADVTANDKDIEICFSEELPDYFYLRAYIVDDEMVPLSEVYNCPLYTEGMQIFLKKTTEDFEEEKVLNLDSNDNNNFLVYKDGVCRINEADSKISLEYSDDEAFIYIFRDPDNELSVLTEASVLSYEMEDGSVLIISIKSISADDSSVTVIGEQIEKENVFAYVKIDSESYATETDVDNSELEDGVEYLGVLNNEESYGNSSDEVCEDPAELEGEGTYSIAKSIGYKFYESKSDSTSFSLSGTVGLTINASVKFYFDLAPWKWEGNYCEVVLGIEVAATVNASGTIYKEIPLGGFKLVPIMGVIVDFTPLFVVQLTGTVSYTGRFKKTVGFRWEAEGGFTDLSTNPKPEHELKSELTLFVGIALKPSVIIISDVVAKVSITARAGVEIKGSFTTKKNPDVIHECASCMNGDVNVKADVSFEASLVWGHVYFKETTPSLTIKIGDWYYSFDYNELGMGTCPHEMYKVTYFIKNTAKEPVKDVVITGNGMFVLDGERIIEKDTVNTGEDGKAEVFQKKGSQVISATCEGYAMVEKKYSVNSRSRTVNISIPTVEEKETGIRKDWGNSDPSLDPSGNPSGILVGDIHNPIRDEDGNVTYATVYFGKYWQNDTNGDGVAGTSDEQEQIKWRVLRVEGDDIFLLANENLDVVPYNKDGRSTTWENCSLRSWLNEEFMNSAFNAKETAAIKYSTLINADNSEYGTEGGSITGDKVFVLSESDVYNTNYGFLDDYNVYDYARMGHNTEYAKGKGARCSNSAMDRGNGWWWLRTPGSYAFCAMRVEADGRVDHSGCNVYGSNSVVRPALHLSLTSSVYSVGDEVTVGKSVRFNSSYLSPKQVDREVDTIAEQSGFAAMPEAIFAKDINYNDENVFTARFADLEERKIYNFYVMKNEFADDSLSDNNLMFISQGTSGEDGNLTFTYKPKAVSDNMAVFVVGMADEEKGTTEPIEPTDPTEPSEPATPEDTSVALTAIAIDNKTAELFEGEKLVLNLSFTPEDATNKKVSWSSSDETVATVADGEVTAIKEGKTVIKAVSEDGNHEAICEVTVKKKEGPLGPDKPDLSKYTASGNEIAAKSINLKKTVFKEIKGIKKFKVSAGDTAAVKIKGSTLTVLADGSVTIEALNKKGEKLAEKTITLVAPGIEEGQPTEIGRRGNLDLNKYIKSTVQPSKWKSSSKKTAEVSKDGLLTMKKSGNVKLTATFPAEKGMKAKTLTIKLKIKMPQFGKTTYTVKAGKTVKTKVKNVESTAVDYRVEDPSIATVSADGVVTGVSKGKTKLVMTVGGIDYTTNLKVK
ncbi:MAG: Ig-like domain-containing protein [Lachnospiraceae bacterium]|nr:Ig-like domain-containing protein [Lachnospiraceae bacterium]